jgi:hypothetical protein
MKLIGNYSDKFFWHKYIEFYEGILPEKAKNILEIGVLDGESIKYWRDKYPEAYIYGIDIIKPLPTWPIDNKINYLQVDQSNVLQYNNSLNQIANKLDVVIEDGSHDPLHQKISLMESIDFLNENAIYILEDIHTSHINHPYYKLRLKEFNKQFSFYQSKKESILMPLQCLLMIEHFQQNKLDIELLKDKFNVENSLFSYEEILKLYHNIKAIKFYKRNVLPNFCYSCKTNDFNYFDLKCSCGTDLYSDSDSMTAVIMF